MMRYSMALAALLVASPVALADQSDRGNNGPAANSATEHAPGQMKDSGSGKDFAPGQMTEPGGSAKDLSPGHRKDNSASSGGDKSGMERKSENSEGRNAKSDRNAVNDADRGQNENRSAQSNGDRTDRDSAKNDSFASQRNSSSGASEGTEGRSGGKGSITGVTEEQRTRVKSVFIQHRVEPARGLNVSVNVGVALPRSVHLYPVPEDIVLIVPEYRGYEYILLDDNRVAIVDPDTFEVVDIIVVA